MIHGLYGVIFAGFCVFFLFVMANITRNISQELNTTATTWIQSITNLAETMTDATTWEETSVSEVPTPASAQTEGYSSEITPYSVETLTYASSKTEFRRPEVRFSGGRNYGKRRWE